MKNHSITAVKGIYLCLLTAYAILREIMIIQNIVGSPLITYGFFGAGMIIIGLEFLRNPRPYFSKGQWLAYLFLFFCVLSTVVNLQVDLFSNVKAIAWMVLYFCLLLPGGWNREGEAKIWEWVMITAVSILVLLSLVALPMYFFDVGYSYIRESGFLFYQGFSSVRLRLWGFYVDPNTAGVYNMIAVCFIAYLFHRTQRGWLRIVLALCCVPLLLLVVLGNSRTVLVAWVIAASWIVFYLCVVALPEKGWKSVGISVAAMAVAAAVAIGAFSVAKTAMPYLKAAVQRGITEQVKASVHTWYDRGYRWSGLNVVEGYYGVAPENQEISIVVPVQPVQNETVPAEQEQPVQDEAVPAETEQAAANHNVQTLERTDLGNDISNGRFEIWRDVLIVARHHLLFGASPRGISQAAREVAPGGNVAMYDYAAHNSFLEVLAGTGLTGFAVFMTLLIWLAVIILRKIFSEGFCWQIAVYGTALLLMVCEMMFISDVFFNLTFGGIAFWMSAGRILEFGRKEDR